MSTKRRITSADNIVLSTVVKFCVGLKLSRSKTLKKIDNSETLPTGGKTFVYKWHEGFREGRISVYDDERTGRQTSTVKELLDVDRCVMVRGIAEQLSLSYYAVQRILTEELNMSKVVARWVPRILTEVDRQKHMQCSPQFLKRYEAHGEDFLDRIGPRTRLGCTIRIPNPKTSLLFGSHLTHLYPGSSSEISAKCIYTSLISMGSC
jgi:hypothetical protein